MGRRKALYTVARIGRYEIGKTYVEGTFFEHLDNEDPQLLREDFLEAVRADQFPDRPSRSRAFFAWSTLADAHRWLAEGEDPIGHSIYAIEAGAACVLFQGDFGWLALSTASFDEWDERAVGYWSGEPRLKEARWEVLVGGPITVVAEYRADALEGSNRTDDGETAAG